MAVIVGGMLGTGARLGLDTLIPHGDTDFPLSTLLINIVGSFVLGLLVARVWTRAATPNWLRVGLGAGLIGSFTTFSALVVSLLAQASHGLWLLAIGYLLLSLVLGFGAAALGLRLGRGRRSSGAVGSPGPGSPVSGPTRPRLPGAGSPGPDVTGSAGPGSRGAASPGARAAGPDSPDLVDE